MQSTCWELFMTRQSSIYQQLRENASLVQPLMETQDVVVDKFAEVFEILKVIHQKGYYNLSPLKKKKRNC